MLKYAQINENNIIVGITYPASEIDASNVIKLSADQEVELGDVYNPHTNTFSRPPILQAPVLPEVSNTELAQQISDIKAELIIAGVIGA